MGAEFRTKNDLSDLGYKTVTPAVCFACSPTLLSISHGTPVLLLLMGPSENPGEHVRLDDMARAQHLWVS